MWSEIFTPKQLRMQVQCRSYPLLWRTEISVLCHEARWSWQAGKWNEPSEIHSSVCSFLYAAVETASHQEYSTCDLLWLVLFEGNCLPLPRSAQSWKPWKFLCFERRDTLRELKMGNYWIPSWHTAVIIGVSTVDRHSFVCYPNTSQYVNVINVYIFFFKDRDSFSLGGSWTHYLANDGFYLLTLLSPWSEWRDYRRTSPYLGPSMLGIELTFCVCRAGTLPAELYSQSWIIIYQ